MRILHIGKYYPPDHGGMESFVRALAMEQAGGGHDVVVLCHAGKVGPGIEHPVPGLAVRRCAVHCRVSGYAPVALALPWHALRQSGDFGGWGRADIVHVHSPNVASYWPVVTRAPLVVHWHSDVLFPRRAPSGGLICGWRMLERLLLRRAQRVVVTSRNYLESSPFLADYAEKCRVVPLALAHDCAPPCFDNPGVAFLRARPEQSGLNMLAVGRLSHYKGFENLLRAMALDTSLRLCLVGHGEEGEKLKDLARELGLADRVLFAGELEDGEVRACLQTCDVFVLPSIARTEAFGMVLLEAMREGVPCVASNVSGSGMTSVLRHGQTGLLVPPEDVCGLKDALRLLAGDAALRQHFGAQGRTVWEQEYRIDRVKAHMDSIYEEAVTLKKH